MKRPKNSALNIPQGAGFGKQQSTQEVRQVEQKPADPYVPLEASDNLFTHQFARIQDAVCEGPIGGFCYPNGKPLRVSSHAPMAVYFDGVPIMNPDGSLNIRGVNVGLVLGTQEQFAIPGFATPMSLIQGGDTLTFNKPHTVAISNTDAVAVEVAVRIGALVKQNKTNGDITGYSVNFRIEVSLNGGSYSVLENVTVTGKASSPYIWAKTYKLPKSDPEATTDTWNIRITRTSRNDASTYVQSPTSFEYINVLNRGSFSYPNTAIVTLEVDAAGYSAAPVRGYHLRLLKVQVPSNYFPETREYNRDSTTGEAVTVEDTDPESETFGEQIPDPQPWDGLFYEAWTDNPAWCFYDLATNPRYGLGKNLTADLVDKWALYSIARYCDVMVEDGFGGEEPRFTCNVYIQSQEEAYKVLSDFASIFRGILFWSGGLLTALQDCAREPYAVFTPANVVEGRFSYSGTAKAARHTVALVRWNDPDEQFRPKYEYVEDAANIAIYGVSETRLLAFGCSSRGQARRLGRWTLLTERSLTNTVTFRTGPDGFGIVPGAVLGIQDPSRTGLRYGGRIIAISLDRLTVTLDRTISVPPTVTVVRVALPTYVMSPEDMQDGDEQRPVTQIERTLASPPVTPTNLNTFTFTEALPAEVLVGAVWVMETSTVEIEYFRVINIAEPEPAVFEISAIEYDPDLYDAVESGEPLEEPDLAERHDNPLEPTPVNALTVSRTVTGTPSQPVLKLNVSWEEPPDNRSGDEYIVEWRRLPDAWQTLTVTSNTFAEIVYTLSGTYEFKVTVSGRFGIRSEAVLVSYIVDNTSPIQLFTVTGLELVGNDSTGQGNDTNFIGKDASFRWRYNSPSSGETLGDSDLDDELQGVGIIGEDPYLQEFEVTIWDVATDIKVYTATTKVPEFIYTNDANRQSIGAPTIGRAQFRIEVVGKDVWGNSSLPAKLTVQNPGPQAPTNLQLSPAFSAVWLRWTNPTDIDFSHTAVYQGTTNVFADATKVAETSGTTVFRGALSPGTTYYFWVVAYDTFGNASSQHPTGGLSTTTASVVATDIANFAITATKIFTKVIILESDVWTDNSPSAGSIAWNSHVVVYAGAQYAIAGGNTAHKYVIWRNAATSYETTDTHPDGPGGTPLADGDFIIATNISGVHDLAWNGIANQVIGSAYIQNAAINNAHIANVSADKIQAGTITGQEIVLATDGLTRSVMKSSNYSAGSAGWAIFSDGTAEFNAVTVRESISVGTGYANPDYPGQLFFAAPTLFLLANVATWDANSPALALTEGYYEWADLDSPTLTYSYNTTAPTRYLHRPFPVNTAIADGYSDIIFAGVALVSGSGVGEYALGNQTDGLLYRRLAFSGANNFRIQASADSIERLTIVFAIIDPVAEGDPFVLPGDVGLPWNILEWIEIPSDTSRRSYVYDRIVRINVPEDKCIVFSLASIDPTGNIGTNLIRLPAMSVTALNVGGPSYY